MFRWLLLAILILPFLDLLLLIELGKSIGTGLTIGLILFTAVVGTYITRWQGLSILFRIQSELANGRVPGNELLDGCLILVGAVLLLTPGLITDPVGFCRLFPASRRQVSRWMKKRLQVYVLSGRWR